MNRFKQLLLSALFVGGLAFAPISSGCAGESGHDHDHDHAGYVCPMHPEVHEDEPGECPVCGMPLEEESEEEHEAHSH